MRTLSLFLFPLLVGCFAQPDNYVVSKETVDRVLYTAPVTRTPQYGPGSYYGPGYYGGYGGYNLAPPPAPLPMPAPQRGHSYDPTWGGTIR